MTSQPIHASCISSMPAFAYLQFTAQVCLHSNCGAMSYRIRLHMCAALPPNGLQRAVKAELLCAVKPYPCALFSLHIFCNNTWIFYHFDCVCAVHSFLYMPLFLQKIWPTRLVLMRSSISFMCNVKLHHIKCKCQIWTLHIFNIKWFGPGEVTETQFTCPIWRLFLGK